MYVIMLDLRQIQDESTLTGGKNSACKICLGIAIFVTSIAISQITVITLFIGKRSDSIPALG
jgi:hypothetical protein